jgi:hypothetical protein
VWSVPAFCWTAPDIETSGHVTVHTAALLLHTAIYSWQGGVGAEAGEKVHWACTERNGTSHAVICTCHGGRGSCAQERVSRSRLRVVSSCNLVKHPFFPSDVGWHGNKRSVIVQWPPCSSRCGVVYLIRRVRRRSRGKSPLGAF